jgi:hypothetical protein
MLSDGMRTLPSFCSTAGLVHPTIDDAVAAWLEERDADALESLRSVGVPPAGFIMRPVTHLVVTDNFTDVIVDGHDEPPIAEGCLIGENLLPLTAPNRDDWLIASDGRVVCCARRGTSVSTRQVNVSFSSFLVFQTCLNGLAAEDEDAVFDVLPALAEVDGWALSSADSPWADLLAEQAFGASSSPEDVDRVRAAAFGEPGHP